MVLNQNPADNKQVETTTEKKKIKKRLEVRKYVLIKGRKKKNKGKLFLKPWQLYLKQVSLLVHWS